MSISRYTPFGVPITTKAARSVSGGRISNTIAAGDIVKLAKMMKEASVKPMSKSHDIGTPPHAASATKKKKETKHPQLQTKTIACLFAILVLA
nr:hypothetical protein [Tanacetum cinerariifolium]